MTYNRKARAILLVISLMFVMTTQTALYHYEIKNSLNFNGYGETLGDVRIYAKKTGDTTIARALNFKPGDVLKGDSWGACMDGFDIYPGGEHCDENCKKNNPVANRLGTRIFYRPGEGNFPATSKGLACRSVVGELVYDVNGYIIFREGGAAL